MMPDRTADFNSVTLSRGKRIIVFAPHPDDDILGCGGSLAKHIDQGSGVTIVYLSSGEAGGLSSERDLKKVRIEEARRAAAELGIEDLLFMDFPDGRIDVRADYLDRVVSLLRLKKPHVLYMPHERDSHRDHVKTNELVLESCRRAAGPWHPQCGNEPWDVSWILAYEIWSPLARISHVEDISQYMSLKIMALQHHQSQIADIAYDDAIMGLNRYRGVTTGRGEFCECFEIIKGQW